MATPPPNTVPIGELVASKYRVTREIGRGGMAAVYEAENVDLGKRVAIKVLAAELHSSPIVVERFQREARAAAAVRSPYICDVYDVGRLESGLPFLVLELLEGESLYERMVRERLLEPAFTVEVLEQVCRGLARAHAVGVVHRDLKPENLFLTYLEDGSVHAKLLDFGLAKFYLGEAPVNRLTREGAVFGTPAYMSPEQVRGQGGVDHRADCWALGCIAYECLVGQTVWATEQGVAMTFAQIASGVLPDPRKKRPSLPPEFGAWFAKALHRDIGQRFQDAPSLAEALRAALVGGVAPRPLPTPTPSPPPVPVQLPLSLAPTLAAVPAGASPPADERPPAALQPPPAAAAASGRSGAGVVHTPRSPWAGTAEESSAAPTSTRRTKAWAAVGALMGAGLVASVAAYRRPARRHGFEGHERVTSASSLAESVAGSPPLASAAAFSPPPAPATPVKPLAKCTVTNVALPHLEGPAQGVSVPSWMRVGTAPWLVWTETGPTGSRVVAAPLAKNRGARPVELARDVWPSAVPRARGEEQGALVWWLDLSGPRTRVHARRLGDLEKGGAAVGAEHRIELGGAKAATLVPWRSGFLLAYADHERVTLRELSAELQQTSTSVMVPNPSRGRLVSAPTLAAEASKDGAVAVVWDSGTEPSALHALRLDPSQAVSTRTPPAWVAESRPGAMNGPIALHCGSSCWLAKPSSSGEMWLSRLFGSGASTHVASGSLGLSLASTPLGRLGAVWIAGEEARFAWIDEPGRATSLGAAEGAHEPPSMMADGEEWLAAWTERRGGHAGVIHAARIACALP